MLSPPIVKIQTTSIKVSIHAFSQSGVSQTYKRGIWLEKQCPTGTGLSSPKTQKQRKYCVFIVVFGYRSEQRHLRLWRNMWSVTICLEYEGFCGRVFDTHNEPVCQHSSVSQGCLNPLYCTNIMTTTYPTNRQANLSSLAPFNTLVKKVHFALFILSSFSVHFNI